MHAIAAINFYFKKQLPSQEIIFEFMSCRQRILSFLSIFLIFGLQGPCTPYSELENIFTFTIIHSWFVGPQSLNLESGSSLLSLKRSLPHNTHK